MWNIDLVQLISVIDPLNYVSLHQSGIINLVVGSPIYLAKVLGVITCQGSVEVSELSLSLGRRLFCQLIKEFPLPVVNQFTYTNYQ